MGRVCVFVPDHPASNNRGYILRSRFVMEKKLGRRLDSSEEVHHINGDPLDDRIENLRVMTKGEHTRHHWRSGKSALGKRRVHDWDLMRKLYEDGLGCRRIAKIIGSSKTAVQYAFKQMGLVPRKKGA